MLNSCLGILEKCNQLNQSMAFKHVTAASNVEADCLTRTQISNLEVEQDIPGLEIVRSKKSNRMMFFHVFFHVFSMFFPCVCPGHGLASFWRIAALVLRVRVICF